MLLLIQIIEKRGYGTKAFNIAVEISKNNELTNRISRKTKLYRVSSYKIKCPCALFIVFHFFVPFYFHLIEMKLYFRLIVMVQPQQSLFLGL